jgi:hypothetical protein
MICDSDDGHAIAPMMVRCGVICEGSVIMRNPVIDILLTQGHDSRCYNFGCSDHCFGRLVCMLRHYF